MAVLEFGPEFIVNSIVDGNQYRPFITSLSTGGFLIGWQDESGKAGVGTTDDTRFSLYDTFGTRLKSDALANSAIASSQFEGASAAMSDGKFVVAWTDYSAVADSNGDNDIFNGGIKFRIFNPDGTPSSGEIYANETTGDLPELRQDRPSVAVLSNGKFVVSWTSEMQPSSLTDVMVRVFNADGSPDGTQKTVNTQTVGDQETSTVHALSTGGFAVVWADREDSSATGFQTKTFVRFYGAGGSPAGQPIVANTSNSGDPSEVGFTELSDGRIVFTWTENQTAAPGDASGTSIRARIYDPLTAAFGTSFRVNTTATNDQHDAQVAALDHGQFVVVWTDESDAGADTSFNAVRMQVFDSTGAKVGNQILVNNQTTFEQANPVVTVLPDFRFVVAWEDNSHKGSDTDAYSVRAQIFDARIDGIDIDGDLADNEFVGSTFGDTMTGAGGADSLFGFGGIDILIGGLGKDLLDGGDDDDKLQGGAGNDRLAGGLGNDILDGGPGADRMEGGDGNDVYIVDSVNDKVIEKANGGIDTVKTTLNSYELPNQVERVIFIGKGNFSVTGNGSDNRMTGAAGNDFFYSDGAGDDAFIGGAGTDTVSYTSATAAANLNFASNAFTGAAKNDSFDSIEILQGSNVAADTMTAGAAAKVFYGLGGDDHLNGGGAGDTLYGGADFDDLRGNGGADTVSGGSGNDSLRGGAGADKFLFSEVKLLGFTPGYGADNVFDFEDGSDKLRFANAVANEFTDLTITGNGTTAVTVATSSGSVVLHAAAAIAITAADVEFF